MSSTSSQPTGAAAAASSLVANYQATLTSVSVKAVGSQLALMSVLSLGTFLAFSFLRPRDRRVYAPKVKVAQALEKMHDPTLDIEPPPEIPNGFFSWLSPVLHVHEEQMLHQIGLDGVTFLRVQRLLRWMFTALTVLAGGVLLPINIIYNLRNLDSSQRNTMALFTIQFVSGSTLWAHVTISYLITLVVCYFLWFNWRKMVLLRQAWFRSEGYQRRIASRTLMITMVPKQYRTDEGLAHLMGQLKVDGIKIGNQIEVTSIGRNLGSFPELVEEHNDAVKNLESALVKYLKNGKVATKRPTVTKGGFFGMGGQKLDAIEYYSKKVKALRDRVDRQRADIDSLIRNERRARKKGRPQQQAMGENYGFVTLKTISEAHRIARAHRGRLKELGGAEIQLAPPPQDLVWKNIKLEPAARRSRTTMGFVYIGLVCFFNTIPLLVVTVLANLAALTVWVPGLANWRNSGQWGDWTFSLVSGILPSTLSFIFGFLLPLIMRSISTYQGAVTQSRLDRAVIARYFAFMIISNFFVFSLLSVAYTAISEVVVKVGEHQSFGTIMKSLDQIPDQIQGTYVQQSTYWLTVFPLRGFLAIFEIAQLIKLALLSVQKLFFAKTPRDIKEYTKPPFFDYDIVLTNLLFLAAIAMIYAPLAPLVTIGCTIVFWISSVVYKYQLLYVYISRAESGGRLYNVCANRIIAGAVFMQLLMVLTIGLSRRRWQDAVATCPPLLILAAFKIFVCRPLEKQFRYYVPTPQEAEAEWQNAISEKRLHHSDVERRFMHPSLHSSELYTVMVHKQQEQLARDVLSEYPWFASGAGVAIKAVRPENLEYDAAKDGVDSDARSIASTDMLGDGKSERGTEWDGGSERNVDVSGYLQRGPMATPSTMVGGYQPAFNGSNDALLTHAGAPGHAAYHQQNASEDIVGGDGTMPFLRHQASDYDRAPPYPPTAFRGDYAAAPLMARSASQASDPEYAEPFAQRPAPHRQDSYGLPPGAAGPIIHQPPVPMVQYSQQQQHARDPSQGYAYNTQSRFM